MTLILFIFTLTHSLFTAVVYVVVSVFVQIFLV